ncbi:YhcN/YlaJ family sporulation lipoprotein [Haloimpatiens lingqiaonensis]|uniref:YhcN/YlaJ family sporulation lipoprotein n=1 Tax=Haloimpatiens lingqiaonensis TaxID=1380675 RepID=UPI0014857BDB|nr:YhcN/YlaJ family sporulation lipoprotein [Haloimpatiens lingqiaonensis]
MKKNHSLATFLITALMCVSLTACATANKPAEEKKGDANINVQEEKTVTENKTLDARAQKIADAVNKIEGVNSSYVVISDKNALVGLDINKDYEGKIADDLRKKVEDTVKNTDKEIQTVALTVDADLTERIKNLGSDIRGGKPLSGLGTEIQEILNRIIPR